jgi:hypothetical protein
MGFSGYNRVENFLNREMLVDAIKIKINAPNSETFSLSPLGQRFANHGGLQCYICT